MSPVYTHRGHSQFRPCADGHMKGCADGHIREHTRAHQRERYQRREIPEREIQSRQTETPEREKHQRNHRETTQRDHRGQRWIAGIEKRIFLDYRHFDLAFTVRVSRDQFYEMLDLLKNSVKSQETSAKKRSEFL